MQRRQVNVLSYNNNARQSGEIAEIRRCHAVHAGECGSRWATEVHPLLQSVSRQRSNPSVPTEVQTAPVALRYAPTHTGGHRSPLPVAPQSARGLRIHRRLTSTMPHPLFSRYRDLSAEYAAGALRSCTGRGRT